MWNPFRKKETRDVNVTTSPSITLSSTDSDAIGLVFGKYNQDVFARNLSAVYRATSLIADSISSLPCKLYKTDSAGNKVEYKTHPVYKLLYTKPNLFFSAHDLFKQWCTDMMLRGNAYGIIHRDMLGKVSQIEYVAPNKVTITKKYGPDGELVQILYNINGRRRLYEADEMIHIKQNLSEDGIEGESILKYAKRTLKLAQASEDCADSIFEDGGMVRGLVSIKGALTEKAKQEIKSAWQKSLGNKSGIAIMSGLEEFKSVSQSNEELEMLASRQFNVVEIARYWQVSPILLYDLTHSNYSSAEQAHLTLLTDTLSEYLYKIEAELENKLLTPAELDRCEIEFDTKEFCRADTKTRLENLRTQYQMGILSINEMRAALDLPPVDDENADERFMQAQMLRVKDFGKEQNKSAVDSVIAGNSNMDASTNEKENTQETNEEDEQSPKDSSTDVSTNTNNEE